MKHKNLTSTLMVSLLGMATVWLTACGSNFPQAEAQELLAMTATPQPEWTVSAQPEATVVVTPTAMPPTATPLPLEATDEPPTEIDEIEVKLNEEIGAANLRRGPGLDYAVEKVIQKGDNPIRANGRTPDGRWLSITHDQAEGWLAAHLVTAAEDLSLLAVVDNIETPVPEVLSAQAKATPTRSPTPLYCQDTPIRGFGKLWGDHREIQATLGCPAQSREAGTNAAVQWFQHGIILWLEADTVYSADPIYVLFEDGSYQRFGELGPADPEKTGETPDGFFEVGGRFSKVYWEGTGSRVKERLGYAIGEASDSPGAFQQFYNGRMFWLGTIDRIFVLYDYYTYDEQENYIRTRSWVSYEDKF